MPYQPVSFDDIARVAALRRYGALDAPVVADLHALSRMAAAICLAPIASVGLFDEDRILMPCPVGIEAGEVPRSWGICEPVVRAGRLFHTDFLPGEEEWKDNAIIQAEPPMCRMYASAPLITPDGHTIGTICVMDTEQRWLDNRQIAALQDLADTAIHLLEARVRTSELRAAVDDMAVRSARDALTGVAGREQLFAVLGENQVLAVPHTVLFCDLDRFKPVNDTYGHRVGDGALAVIGERLAEAVRAGELAARIGGDEFVIVIPGSDDADAAGLAARIEELVAEPMVVDGHELQVGVSIGWAAARPGEAPADLLARADAAMYATKSERRVSP